MLKEKDLKQLKLTVTKTKMIKLCQFYFPELLNKKSTDFYFYKGGTYCKLECGSYDFHLFVNCCKVLLTERNSDVSYIVDYDDLFKFHIVKEK